MAVFDHERLLRLFRILSVLLVAIVTIRVAWISDDALITLRTALNISHNWGPGFNATESVQAYTHPLWFLLWVWVGTWTNQWMLGIIAVSTVFVAIATWIVVQRATTLARLTVVVAFLLLSNAFIDFTTSGLENPLSYAGVAVLMALSLRRFDASTTPVWWPILIGLTAASVFLTRMDFLVLITIPIAALLWEFRRSFRFLVVTLSALLLPLTLWFVWTYLTYASLLPNTFAAKTNADIPRSEFIVQGMRYLWVSFENDPVTLIGLSIGIGLGITFGPRVLRTWAFGALAYVAYVVWIGGDFMGGRFLSVPFFVAIFILAASPLARPQPTHEQQGGLTLAASFAAVAVLVGAAYVSGIQTTALANPQAPRWELDQNFNAGIVDARGSSVADGDSLKGLVDKLSLAFVDPDIAPIGDGTGLGRDLRSLDKAARNWPVNDGSFTRPSEVGVFCGYLGNIGIATGPITHLIDYCALTDRYLAEKPFVPAEPFAWKPGHFDREVTDDYVDAVATNDPMKMRDTAEAFRLRELWEKIR